jgi:hypothetical protein
LKETKQTLKEGKEGMRKNSKARGVQPLSFKKVLPGEVA